MHSQQSSSEWGQINSRIRRHYRQLEVGVSQEEYPKRSGWIPIEEATAERSVQEDEDDDDDEDALRSNDDDDED